MPPWLVIFQPKTIMEKTTTLQSTLVLKLAIILSLSSLCYGSPCHTDSWWDPVKDKCIPCTECNQDQKLIVLRPCQLHQDTICGTIHDLAIDYMLLTRTEPNWKDRRKERNYLMKSLDDEDSSYMDEEEFAWDWQATLLILAVIACLMFFLAAAYISAQHMRQWRQMERRLDRDVEELSAKLMAKLANVQNVENGNFIIENPIRDQHARPLQVHCVVLENFLADKDQIKMPQRGNVYIEDSHSK